MKLFRHSHIRFVAVTYGSTEDLISVDCEELAKVLVSKFILPVYTSILQMLFHQCYEAVSFFKQWSFFIISGFFKQWSFFKQWVSLSSVVSLDNRRCTIVDLAVQQIRNAFSQFPLMYCRNELIRINLASLCKEFVQIFQIFTIDIINIIFLVTS